MLPFVGAKRHLAVIITIIVYHTKRLECFFLTRRVGRLLSFAFAVVPNPLVSVWHMYSIGVHTLHARSHDKRRPLHRSVQIAHTTHNYSMTTLKFSLKASLIRGSFAFDRWRRRLFFCLFRFRNTKIGYTSTSYESKQLFKQTQQTLTMIKGMVGVVTQPYSVCSPPTYSSPAHLWAGQKNFHSKAIPLSMLSHRCLIL